MSERNNTGREAFVVHAIRAGISRGCRVDSLDIGGRWGGRDLHGAFQDLSRHLRDERTW